MGKPREWTLVGYWAEGTLMPYTAIESGPHPARLEEVKVVEKTAADKLAEALGRFLNSDDAMRVVDVSWLNDAEQALKDYRGEQDG